MKSKAPTTKILNKHARLDFAVLDTYEAGIVLTGAEVKSLRLGRAQLKDSYVAISQEGELRMINAHISAYPFARNEDYNPTRSRALLLRRSEIERLRGITQQKGVSLVPLSVYVKAGKFKVEVGVVRGKKQFEKREQKKRADIKRELARDYKLRLRD